MNNERTETEPVETIEDKVKQAEDIVFKCKEKLYALSLSFAAFSWAEEHVKVDLAFWSGLHGICDDIATDLLDACDILNGPELSNEVVTNGWMFTEEAKDTYEVDLQFIVAEANKAAETKNPRRLISVLRTAADEIAKEKEEVADE